MTFHSEAFQIFAYIAFTLFVLASMGKPASAPTPQPTSTPVDDEFGEDLTNEFNANFLDMCPEPIWETEPKVTKPEPTNESALALIGICLGCYDESLVVPKSHPSITTNKLTVPIWETDPEVTQPTNYHQMNSKELRELAKVHQVKGWWNMKKSQIIAELEKLA